MEKSYLHKKSDRPLLAFSKVLSNLSFALAKSGVSRNAVLANVPTTAIIAPIPNV